MIRFLVLLLVLATPVFAVEPDEMLADVALEARAQALDEELRCVRCRSENIASSNADWARDARLLVRELIEAGASDGEVRDYFVERYGEVVLMRPTTGGANIFLWAAAPVMLLVAMVGAFTYLRRRSTAAAPIDTLSDDEQARLQELLDQ